MTLSVMPRWAAVQAVDGPPLSQPVKDILQGEFGVDPRKLDPARPADAALIRQARVKAKEEKRKEEQEKTDREAQGANFLDIAEKRYAGIVASGKTITWNKMRGYLESRGAGKRYARQVARKLAR